MSDKWECPICGSNAYQRYGGIKVPATKIDESTSPPTYSQTSMVTGRHFMCKGCSAHFGNPNLFNADNVDERQLKKQAEFKKSIFSFIGIEDNIQ